MDNKFNKYFELTDDNILTAMEGVYDLHVHTDPDVKKREFDDITLLKDLEQVKMAGAVIKSHAGQTADKAYYANHYGGAKAKIFGSLTLNEEVGGLNLAAVEAAVALGIKSIWFPTTSALTEIVNRPFGHKRRKDWFGIYILNENGELLPEVYEILEIARSNNIIVNTGHLTAREGIALCDACCEMKVKHIMTHPNFFKINVPLSEQVRLAKKGTVIELNWHMMHADKCDYDPMRYDTEFIKSNIDKIGAENCVMVSDTGILGHLNVPRAFYAYIKEFLRVGFKMPEIRQMCYEVPLKLID